MGSVLIIIAAAAKEKANNAPHFSRLRTLPQRTRAQRGSFLFRAYVLVSRVRGRFSTNRQLQ